MTSMDPGPVSREEQVEAAQAILNGHLTDGVCDRCRPDGTCPGVEEAAVRLANERDRLRLEGRTDHPLFAWQRPGGVREALRTGGAVLVVHGGQPRAVGDPEDLA